MSQDIKVWTCTACQLTVDIPPEYPITPYTDALMWIREHRFAHLVSALEKASDEELMGMSGDQDRTNPWAQGDLRAFPSFTPPSSPDPVQTEDVEPVLAGITELLKADLPRARRGQNNG